MKILIVDDDRQSLYMLETLLRGHGYQVESAADGVEALEKASQDGFDMIIADILMPRMDGFQLCREVKTDEKLKDIAFVFYTATYTEPKDEEFALSLGAEKFIVKPTEPDVFIEILEQVIKSYETGTLIAPKAPIEEESVYLREYNERLIKKLEDKMLELESVNKELTASEKKYRELIESANDGVILFERTGYISFVNRKFCEMTGYSIEEAKRLRFDKLIHPDDVDMVSEYIRETLAGKRVPRNYEVRLLTKAGNTIYVDNNTSPIEKEGVIVGILSIMRDVTRRKETEEQLRRYSEDLEEMVRGRTVRIRELERQRAESEKLAATGRMAARIAHEINNPLAGIKNSFLLVKDGISKDHPHYKYVRRIEKEINRIARIVHRMFDLYRPDSKVPRKVSVSEAIRDVVALLQTSCRAGQVEIKVKMPERPILAELPAGYVDQVLFNIVQNSIEASGPGGVIEVTAHVEQDVVTIKVTDQGCGIPEHAGNRIFEPFFTTKDGPEASGLGLGLSVSKSMVEAMGGTIGFESKPSKGTVFTITIPLRAETEEVQDRQPGQNPSC